MVVMEVAIEVLVVIGVVVTVVGLALFMGIRAMAEEEKLRSRILAWRKTPLIWLISL